KHVLNGDSIHAQHAAVAHFGLGSSNAVTAYEVRWPDGHVTRVDHPEIDRYHHVGE
ncbi:MAG: ASPIC/UnbV domain-containing protein, partial [Planctomycetales bacterium]|nr:ASPIC/UnbV domain-containing protein [Planctomycetales bacterium]